MSTSPSDLFQDAANPKIERSIRLDFFGDWGLANLHVVCGFLSHELWHRTGKHSRFAIWNGRGGTDAVRAVGRGEVDVALTTPAAFAAMGRLGLGPYEGEAFPHLRALGNVPQWDHLVLAVKSDVGITSFAELREKKPPLKISCCPDDGVNHIGYAVHRIMEAAGISQSTLESWGGSYVEEEHPNTCIELVHDGKADAIFHEAIMTPWWQELCDRHDLAFLDIEEAVLDKVTDTYKWTKNMLPAGYFRGLDRDLATLDFSDFLLMVREDMAADVAYLLTWCLCERRELLERRYRHIPRERSPVSYPLEPAKIAESPIPLHDGALAYYKDAGVL